MLTTRTIVIAAPLLAAVALGGCVDNRNQRLSIGDEVMLASLPPEVVEPSIDDAGDTVAPPPPADDAPSALGLDRSNFEPMSYRVPIDGTRHEFHGWDRVAFASETARQRGEFPTATTAIETGGWASTRGQASEMLVQPVFAVGELGYGVVATLWLDGFVLGIIPGSGSSPGGYERAPVAAEVARLGVIHEPLPGQAIDADQPRPAGEDADQESAAG